MMHKRTNIFQRIFTFSGEMGRGEFWSGLVPRVIGAFCSMVIAGIVVAVVVPGDTEQLIVITNWVTRILGILWMLPVIPQTRRRLRDAGYPAKSYYWLLLPVIGWIVFIMRLCGPGVSNKK